jgi:hypothetical protein
MLMELSSWGAGGRNMYHGQKKEDMTVHARECYSRNKE